MNASARCPFRVPQIGAPPFSFAPQRSAIIAPCRPRAASRRPSEINLLATYCVHERWQSGACWRWGPRWTDHRQGPLF